MVYRCGRTTKVGEQWLRGNGERCAWNLMCGEFITGICHQPVKDDQLGLGASGSVQMFQYCKVILVSPVVKHFAQEENGDVLLSRRLRIKEIVSFGPGYQSAFLRRCKRKVKEPWIVTRPDSSALGIFSFQNCDPYVVRHVTDMERSVDSEYVPQLHLLRQRRGPG